MGVGSNGDNGCDGGGKGYDFSNNNKDEMVVVEEDEEKGQHPVSGTAIGVNNDDNREKKKFSQQQQQQDEQQQQQRERPPNLMSTASCWSRTFFTWPYPLLKQGYESTLVETDLPEIMITD